MQHVNVVFIAGKDGEAQRRDRFLEFVASSVATCGIVDCDKIGTLCACLLEMFEKKLLVV